MSACVSGTGVITHNSKQHGVDGRRHAVVLRHWRWVADDEARNFRPMMCGGKKFRVQPKTTRVVSWCIPILFYIRSGTQEWFSLFDSGWRRLAPVVSCLTSNGQWWSLPPQGSTSHATSDLSRLFDVASRVSPIRADKGEKRRS